MRNTPLHPLDTCADGLVGAGAVREGSGAAASVGRRRVPLRRLWREASALACAPGVSRPLGGHDVDATFHHG
jgi:hypothetical protein